MQRKIQFAEREFFHVYNRGVDKRKIFLNHSDHQRFLELLFLANSLSAVNIRDIRKSYESVFTYPRLDQLVHIGAYCLMPNHFHILLTPAVEDGVHRFMKKLSTGYSMYFNKRYDRTGSLLQGRYKAEHADTDEYLKYLYSYIHLNPVKLWNSEWREDTRLNMEAAFTYAVNYQYSSLPDYLRMKSREESAILNSNAFPEYFVQAGDHKAELFDWLSHGATTQP